MLKDILFPKFCMGCGQIGSYICLKCESKLVVLKNDICIYCERRTLYGLTHPICRRKYGIDGFLALFRYNNFLKKIIKHVKYRYAQEVLHDLFIVIKPQEIYRLSVYKKLFGDFVLCPIPIHTNKLTERGFNQAEIILQKIYLCLGGERVDDVLIKDKPTLAQATLKGKLLRAQNIRGSFGVINEKIKKKNIILIDDVVTTGSTVREAARVLKKSGAAKIFVFALAKG